MKQSEQYYMYYDDEWWLCLRMSRHTHANNNNYNNKHECCKQYWSLTHTRVPFISFYFSISISICIGGIAYFAKRSIVGLSMTRH